MTASYILALDQGTTSSRAILFDRRGRMLQVAQKEFTQIYPRPGWVEHSPDEIFDTQAHVARDCLKQAGVQGHELAAVGITNQRETTVVWDRAGGAPVYNAIVWQDRRTAAVCDRLRAEGKAEIIRQKTGLVLDAYFSGTKIGWILDNVPGARPRESRNNLLATVAWETPRGRSYALEGSVFAGGAVVQWLRDGLGFIRDSSEMEGLAASVPDNGGVYLVPAFTGLGAPHWDQYARGILVGLTRGTERGHIARAAIEAIALQTLDVMEAMRADAGLDLSLLRVDGGASRNNMLMQCQADLTGVAVERPVVTETTALGAACLAGLAVGFWQDEEEAASLWQLDRRFEPKMPEERRAELLHHWRRAVERSRRWIETEE